MRKVLTILFLCLVLKVSATDYYVKNGGSDAAAGTSDGTAWETIDKVNTVWAAGTFAPGDNIYFKRGSTFYDGIVVTESGTSGSPITISAYGTGVDPIISGFTTLSSWSDEGGGIYSKAVTPENDINVVTIDGIMYGMGREPEASEGYNTYETFVTTVSITDADSLNSAVIDWTGAEVVIRKNDYTMPRCRITLHSGSTLTYTDNGGTSASSGTANYGYFIQNDLQTLDTYGEWFYDAGTFYMYFGAVDPTTVTVKVSTIDNLIYSEGYDYIDIEDIQLTGANISGINLDGVVGTTVTYVNVDNCDISFSGWDGVKLDTTYYCTFDSLTISYSGRAGIYSRDGTDIDVTYCNISYSGTIPGMAYTGGYGVGIRNNYSTGSLIQYNRIDYSGSNGIYIAGSDIEVRNNLVNHSGQVMVDIGGIYTGGSTLTGRIIDGNIVLNTEGNNSGANPARLWARGIYLDAFASHVTVTNNTIAYSGDYGIAVISGHENTITGNLCYDNKAGFYIQDIGTNPIDNVVTGNYFIAKTNTQRSFTGWASNAVVIAAFTTLDNNYYARPIDNGDVVYIYSPGAMTLAEWQTLSSLDASTVGSPKLLTNVSQIYFYYNASSSTYGQILPVPMIDMDDVAYPHEYTIPAWSGVVLLEGTLPTGEITFAKDTTGVVDVYMKDSDGNFMIIIN